MALEAAYAFDGSGTTVLDLSGNSRHLDLTGSSGAQVTGGQTGNALGKTGATMPVLPSSVLAACQTDDRTIMFDAKQNVTTWWVRFNDPTFGSGMWGVLNLGSMAVQARDNTGSHNLATRPTATAPDASNWHNYCATYVRSTGVISIYRDGTLAATSSFSAGTQLSTSATAIDVAEWSSTGAAVDNLRIYSHALNSTEVAALAGTPVAASGPTGSGTLASPSATAAGTATVTASGTGSATATPSTAAGAAGVVVSGAGSLAVPPSTTTGVGAVAVGGGGIVTAQAGLVSGAALALVGAAGSAAAGPASAVGGGGVLVTGVAALLAPSSVIVGLGSTLSAVTGSGSAVAPAAVVSGSDTAPADTPLERTVIVPAESRLVVVPAESRILEV